MKRILLSIILSLFLISPVYAGPWISGGSTSGSGTGDVATDTIWDAAGDIVYGTGNDSAAVISHPGSSNNVLVTTMNAQCTASSTPWSCCTGSGTGTCDNKFAYTATHQHSDSEAQFYSTTASKGTRKLVQSSIDNGIVLTDTPVITGNVTWTNISQGAGTYTRVFEESANVFTVKQEFDATTGLQVGSTGVLITSDNDGAITFTGASAGYDEDLTINLDDTENTAVISSSTGVTKVDFSAMNMVTTGYIDGGIPVTKSTDATITVSGMTRFYVNADDDAIAFNLPADPTNKAFCFANLLYAKAITVNPDDADYIVHAGKTAAAGEAYVSSGARTDQLCVVGIDSSYWLVTSERGTWAEETP